MEETWRGFERKRDLGWVLQSRGLGKFRWGKAFRQGEWPKQRLGSQIKKGEFENQELSLWNGISLQDSAKRSG